MTENSANLVYEEIRERLRSQETQLENLRTRSGSIIAVAAVAVSFMGGAVLDGHSPPSWAFWLGLTLFALVVLVGLSVMNPRDRTWLFSPQPRVLLEDYLELDESETKRYLAEFMAGWVPENDQKLQPLYLRTRWAVLLSGLIVLLLSIELGGLT